MFSLLNENVRLSVSNLTDIWGCTYIEGDTLKRMVFGGKSGGSAYEPVLGTSLILPTLGAVVESKTIVTPTITTSTLEGMMYLSIGAIASVEVTGRMKLTYDRSTSSVDGDILGKFDFDKTLGITAEAEGQLNWHFGKDYNCIQGRAKLSLSEMIAGGSLSGGVFIGLDTPRNEAWILYEGEKEMKGVDVENLPEDLTGVYIYGAVSYSQSCGIFSGGFDLYAGIGAFLPDDMSILNFATALDLNDAFTKGLIDFEPPLPYLIGNVGGRLYGEILWGAVSAEGTCDLQIGIGNPYFFEGSVGLKGCIAWIFCVSVDLMVGMSTEKGVYFE
jgi:hypothetical protein